MDTELNSAIPSKSKPESESIILKQKDVAAPESVDEDDSRSSSLSDIEDGLDNDPLDSISPVLRKTTNEVDSEAETERIEESPNKTSRQGDIYVRSEHQVKSPSKLSHSASAGDVDKAPTQATTIVENPRRDSLNSDEAVPSPTVEDMVSPSHNDVIGKKRKRSHNEDGNLSSGADSDQPLRKRTGSIKDPAIDKSMDDENGEDEFQHHAERPEKLDEEEDTAENGASLGQSVADDVEESDRQQMEIIEKKPTQGRKKDKQTEDVPASEAVPEVSVDSPIPTPADEAEQGEEDEEGGEDADDTEVAAKNEEGSAKKMSAMDSLAAIEKQFATFRDKIYDDRLAQLNDELAQLQSPNPTHADYLAMLKCIEQRRDEKIRHANKLFEYQVKALKTKSVAERAQINSQFFQYNRDLRDRHMEMVGDEMYRIQRDRWGAEGTTPNYAIPFPTKRSQQITNQTAYNKEVSILSGVAKYVGFPAAPEVEGINKSQLEEDFEKMGITTQVRAPVQPPIQLARGNFSSSSTAIRKSSAEEQFLEQTPWANPQHPIHNHHLHRRISEQARADDSFTTPAAQKRVVDLTAPNGSASTLPEPSSGPASSLGNTPAEKESASNRAYQSAALASGVPNDGPVESRAVSQMSESRSLPSSPIDHRKTHITNQSSTSFQNNTGNPSQAPRSSVLFHGGTIPATRSPLSTRQGIFSPPPKAESANSSSMATSENKPSNGQTSPVTTMKSLPGTGIAASGGMNGIASR